MQARRERGGSGLLWMAILVLAALVILAMLPTQLPGLENVRFRSHAVQRHGQDAIAVREALSNCGDGLRVKLCPASERFGLSVIFWCQEPGRELCPGMATTIGGVERSSYFKPCEQWARCR